MKIFNNIKNNWKMSTKVNKFNFDYPYGKYAK